MRALIFDPGGHVKMKTSAHDDDDDDDDEGMEEEDDDEFGGSVYRKNE